LNRNISIPDGHGDTEIFHPRWSELKLIIMKSIELKYPVIVREPQGRFDHPKIFRQPGVETPGYSLSSLKGLKVFYLKDLL